MRFYKVEEAAQRRRKQSQNSTRLFGKEKICMNIGKKIMKLNDFETLGVPKIRPYFRFTLSAQRMSWYALVYGTYTYICMYVCISMCIFKHIVFVY